MGFVSGIIVFVMIWWTVIFCILPIGVSRTQEEPTEKGEYIAPGAPKNVNMKHKVVITTAIAFLIWCVIAFIMHLDVISFREMAENAE